MGYGKKGKSQYQKPVILKLKLNINPSRVVGDHTNDFRHNADGIKNSLQGFLNSEVMGQVRGGTKGALITGYELKEVVKGKTKPIGKRDRIEAIKRYVRSAVNEQKHHEIGDGDIAEYALSMGATVEEIEEFAGWPKGYIKKSLAEKNNTTFDQIRDRVK